MPDSVLVVDPLCVPWINTDLSRFLDSCEAHLGYDESEVSLLRCEILSLRNFRDNSRDDMEALTITAELRQQAVEVLDLLHADQQTDLVIEKQRFLLAGVVALRSANRNAWLSSREAKAKTSETKSGIDRMNLELQGLHYEQRHLKAEIQACIDTP